MLMFVCSYACLKDSPTQTSSLSPEFDQFHSFIKRKEMPQKKMDSWYSFGTKNKSSLNVVVIAQSVPMPGMSMRRSLMLLFWDEGLVQ